MEIPRDKSVCDYVLTNYFMSLHWIIQVQVEYIGKKGKVVERYRHGIKFRFYLILLYGVPEGTKPRNCAAPHLIMGIHNSN